LRDDRLQRTLTSLAELSESASRTTRNLEEITHGVEVGPAVDELRTTTTEVRMFLSDLREQQVGTRLSDTLDEYREVARLAQSLLFGLQEAVERLDRTLSNVETLTDDVSRQPSRLLFADPPPEDPQ
jgi:hypothetical protein